MQLTSYTDYSLRMLIYLAAVDYPKLSSIKEISRSYNISYNHLTKVGHELSKLGLIKTVKGRNGGIRLAKEPEQVNIGWIVRRTEDNLNLVECFDPENSMCVLTGSCRLQSILTEALNAYLKVLDHYTLADVTINRSILQELLHS
ncbi:Rrf2 family nitric oxide-sensitive transcriptional repressor [Salibacterium salarium]|uniref:RrF2 family transcriptional regulator n=1 Tax=Salibacterium salarium TaxID=284579 RepID=UPI0027879FF3|nr:Rrf2 family transcriptional regulator [Salibacterium salarium]MDQ0298743.1 Rrf2 family nitric oxide-sensitive transcriptional repressor [Salibacterium salarium]